jgi:beta-glucanase (GH16 family)
MSNQWRVVSLALFGLSLLAGPVRAQTWSQIWSAEFNGTGAASSTNWTYETGGGGWGNGELEYYQGGTANASQANGVLTIQARHQSVGGMPYTSARIKTQGKHSFGPGDAHPQKIQASIAGPNGQGLWPAFWMLGTDITSVPWPGCGEIDIMEHINSAGNVWGTIHWADAAGAHASYTASTPGVNFTAWNTYALTWDNSQLRWFLNGAQTGAADILNNVNHTEEFHRSFFVLLNLAVGGSWPGNPNSSTAFPANMRVDFVRHFQG